MCLVLGATGVGKTLLVKRLENSTDAIKKGPDFSFEDMPATIATVGTNLVAVSVSRRQEITMRELGGCMGPIWKNYFKEAVALMYVIDLSNRLQVAASCIQLLTVLTAKTLSPTVPVLIVFNKMDMPDKLTHGEIETLFRLSDIKSQCGRSFEQVEVSACTGQGLSQIVKWMEQNCFGK
ncbi:ADP-ribosylation factor-like protein 16 [Mercenaria mercenaria]|uniref:ADP-ribosylation factor-like protein 16 n=1 Tax=Mercenaria mercenaria TaxID=6596 RepID=UPI00234E5D46|nr:ADP-ribosylation factor-like protein 16 [Mercenaria mercenaria]